MPDYIPKLIHEYEIRNSFSPPLDYDDINKANLLLIIESVEDYIRAVYFNNSMPSRDDGKVPALLMVLSKVLFANHSIVKKYGLINYIELGDYKLGYEYSGKGEHVTAFESAKSWDQMAHEMLLARSKSQNMSAYWPGIRLVNG
jgi:hypothetical protein